MQQLLKDVKDLVGISLSASQVAAFTLYEEELAEWNRRFNLTAIRAAEEVRRKHFLDSLSCLLAMADTPMARVVDVGAGAGFPGLPLKIVNPEINLTLVESVRKKTKFITHIVNVLELDGVETLPTRAERVGRMPAHRESYDWALARAVAKLPVLVEYLLPLVRVGGKILAQKGVNAEQEVELAQTAIARVGGKFEKIIPVDLPDAAEQRYLVVIRKVAETPDTYPRREGIPKKRPL